ncbi:MAG TPA: hypothetical protein PKY25_01705 [Bacilli bacterium]|nr:hypothetical protein [Bacilli bacterium]
MKWYKNLKEKYNNIFDNPKKKAALKLSIGIIFLMITFILLKYSPEPNYNAQKDEYSYSTTIELLTDVMDVTEALDIYIDDNYAFLYKDSNEECTGKRYKKIYYIKCNADKKYYFDGNKNYYYLKNVKQNEEASTSKYFYNLDDLRESTYVKNETNFDGSKTYYYEKDNVSTNITFYKQDLLKIENSNILFIYKNHGKMKETDITKNFE